MLHFPILRKGEPYKSVDVIRTPHHRTREMFVEISQANSGLIRRDLLDQRSAKAALDKFTVAELMAICKKAAEEFLHGTLPLGDSMQSTEDYVQQLSATTGMPYVMVRRNMKKIYGVMAEMGNVLGGLSRKLDLSILDRGYGSVEGQAVSYFPRTDSLGVVLPNNSPGVHSLWIPSIVLKTPLVLKPGSAEPWTPHRIIQAFVKAGAPPEAFCFYPTDHAGANEILRSTGRGMLFGDVGAVKSWANDGRIELHGPGYSKVVLGDDCVDNWAEYLDVMVTSIAANGGRSCVNASGVWVTRHGDEIAAALSERLAKIVPRASDDPQATLAPFANPAIAHRIDSILQQGGLPSRIAEHEGCTYLLPTAVRVDSPEHPLANKEFLFPFASVVEVRQEQMPAILGSTLVVTAITKDQALLRRLLTSPQVGRLNIGPVPTGAIRWDQPHEGNLFDHLYARRAFELALV